MKHLSILLSVALLCGCQDKPAESPASPKSAAAEGATSAASTAPKAIASTNALLAAKAALSMVPKQADIVAMTGNLGALINDLGRAQVVKAIPQLYAQAATVIRSETGADLLDPAQWKTLGVDVDGPGGMFILTRSLTVGFVITLSDTKVFEGWWKGRFADKQGWTALPVAGGTVYMRKYAPTVVIKGEHLILLGADRDALAAGWGVALAGMEPIDSIASDARVEAAAQRVGFGAHAGGFVDTQRTIDAIIGLQMRSANPDAFMLQGKLRALGQTEIAERLNRFTRGRSEFGEQMAVAAIKGMIVGGVGPLALGIEIEGAAVRLKGHLQAKADALPRRILEGRTGSSPLATLAGPKAVLMLDGNVDLVKLMATVNTLVMTAGGTAVAKMEAEIRREFGLDVRTQIIPAFTGEVGGAMLHQNPDLKGDKSFGMTLFAGVDPAKMQIVLDAVAGHPHFSKMIVKTGTRYQVKLPWRTVEAELKGNQLIVSTDPTAFDRAPGRSKAAHLGATLGGVLSAQATTLTGAMDLARIFAFTMISFSDWEMPMRDIANPDADAKQKLARRAELSTQIAALRESQRKTDLTAINDMVGPLGHIALTAAETDDGLRFDGGVFTRGPYLKAIGIFATQASTVDARRRALRAPLHALQEERRKIDGALRDWRAPSKPARALLP
ncbi:MAG: hypothetical protein ACI9U2_001379 [Bradymonadia bacterium]|jgi:hypothetical protein